MTTNSAKYLPSVDLNRNQVKKRKPRIKRIRESILRKFAPKQHGHKVHPVRTIEDLQKEIEEVEEIVRNNVLRALKERNEKLEILEVRAEALKAEANKFSKLGSALRRKQQKRNRRILVATGCSVSLAIVVVTVVLLVV